MIHKTTEVYNTIFTGVAKIWSSIIVLNGVIVISDVDVLTFMSYDKDEHCKDDRKSAEIISVNIHGGIRNRINHFQESQEELEYKVAIGVSKTI